MTGIPESIAVKLLADTIKTIAPVGQWLAFSKDKFLEILGHVNPELTDILQGAIAQAYVKALREITEDYLTNEKRRMLQPASDKETHKQIEEHLQTLLKKPQPELVSEITVKNLAPTAGFDDDDDALASDLIAKAKQDLGTLPEALQSTLERQLLRNVRQKLWLDLSKSSKDGKSSSLMYAFLFELLTGVGQSAKTAKINSERLVAQLELEIQLDRFELDQDLLRVRTRFFVNRGNVFHAIDEFLKTDSGYFVIRAEGGLGKTAVAAKYILSNPDCIYHFLSRELGPQYQKPAGYTIGSPRNTIEECLRMLSQQLELRLGMNVLTSADLRTLENRFNKLLKTWVEQRSEEKLVIVIDGLDESENLQQFFNYFPERPLRHIYFILTTRPLENIPEWFATTGTDLGNLSLQDTCEMVSEANAVLAANENFVRKLHDVSGGHPLYLYHVVDAVFYQPEKAQEFLEKIPNDAINNIDGYYRWQLKQLVTGSQDDNRQVGPDTLDLLWILSLLREAVTKEDLQEISGLDSVPFARAFSKARRYLIGRSILGRNVYGLFHPRFQQIVQEEYRKLLIRERKACLERIVQHGARWRERLTEEIDSNDYTLRHHAQHLYELAQETKDSSPLLALLQDKQFLRTKIERFGRYSAVLPDIGLAIEGAAKEKKWIEVLRFCLLEGYVREAAKDKWQTGSILLDAVEGNLEFAVQEARAISDRDARGLQLILIAEWLLRQPDKQSRDQGGKLAQECIELWTEVRPFVTHEIEEGIMDFATTILFCRDPALAEHLSTFLTYRATRKK